MMSYLYDDTQMEVYQAQKKMIKKTKNKFYTYLIILGTGLTAVYLAVLSLEKKEMIVKLLSFPFLLLLKHFSVF